MFILSLYRVIKFAFQNFIRNFWLSFVTITIIFLTLVSLTTLIVINVIADQAVLSIKDKIDISMYFKSGAPEEQVSLIQQELEKFEEIKAVDHISAEDALAKFKERHSGENLIQEAITEIGDNPLGPTLVIHAHQVEEYPAIMEKIQTLKIDTLVDEIDYQDHVMLINKLNGITDKIKKAGIIISVIFAIIALLTVFNTIRVGIYIHKDEIGIMKLVGANNWFIRAPFIIESLLYALLGCLVFWIVLWSVLGFLDPMVTDFFAGIDFQLSGYFHAHFLEIFGFELIVIAILNMISSAFAMRKYLDV